MSDNGKKSYENSTPFKIKYLQGESSDEDDRELNEFKESESIFDSVISGVSRYAKFGLEFAKVSSGYKDNKNLNQITNDIFFDRHTELKRDEPLKPHQKELIKEWLSIRDNVVKPIITELQKKNQTTHISSRQQTTSSPHNLPLVLAGPIVRRASKDSIWFWLALSEKITEISANIFRYNNQGLILDEISVQTSVIKVLQLGKNLWIALAKIVPSHVHSFPTDTIIGYDLTLVTEGYNASHSRKLSELPISSELNYPPFQLPTLLIGEKNTQIAHGSCRRPGYGIRDFPESYRDAFVDFDDWISRKAGSLHERPASLILTGDQIYADDLATPMFDAIQKIANDVFGYIELINIGIKNTPSLIEIAGFSTPFPKYPGLKHTSDHFKPSTDISFTPQGNDKFSERKKLTHYSTSLIGFSTNDGEAHLLSFPEYASMYLLVWCPELWNQYCTNDYEIQKQISETYHTLRGYDESIRSCRRVMANSATYMILDDHEYTDDYKSDLIWNEITKEDPTAQQILSNASIAYFAFQAWGNDPDMFDDNFVNSISNYLTSLMTNNGTPPNNAKDLYLSIFNRQWSFVTASNPKALCVDIRNGRDYPVRLTDPDRKDIEYESESRFVNELVKRATKSIKFSRILNPITLAYDLTNIWNIFDLKNNTNDKSTVLVGKRARDNLERLKNRFTENDVLLLVLPTPFFGHPFHIIAQDILFPFPNARYPGDWELFDNNTGQRASLIYWLKEKFNPSSVVIFSGDVHYGSVVYGGYTYSKSKTDAKRNNFEWKLPVIQITSSGIKNGKKILWKIMGGKPTREIAQILAPLTKARYSSDSGGFIGVGMRTTKLSGTLSNDTIVHRNHICVVSMPSSENNKVKAIFIGQKDNILATSETSIDVRNEDFVNIVENYFKNL